MGFGTAIGGGFEFHPHWSFEGGFTLGRSSNRNVTPDHIDSYTFRATIIGLGY